MRILSLFLFVLFMSVAFLPKPAAAADINYQACWPTHGGICKKSISGLPACSLIPPGETSAGACVGDPSYVSGETWQCCVPNATTSSSYPDSAACTADGGIPRGITGCSPGETLKGAIVGPPAGDCCNPATTTTTTTSTATTTTTSATTSTAAAATGFAYQPLENIPGAKGVSSFPDYVQGIYKFAIWTVGLAALFMLSVGGFIYLSSGGNTATIGKAKTYIWDALIGLVLALLAYLILYVINPDLVNVNLGSFSRVGGTVAPITAATPVVQKSVTPTANETLTNASNITAAMYDNVWYTEAAPVPADSTNQKNMVSGFTPYGIIVKDSAGHTGTSALCATEKQAASCTSLYQFPSSAADILKTMADQCRVFNDNKWCTISITGGTEYWKHSTTTNHRPGNPVIDIGKNSSSTSFFNYLQSVAKTATCTRSNRAVYTIPVNTATGLKYVYLWDEDDIHWHVNVNVDMCH